MTYDVSFTFWFSHFLIEYGRIARNFTILIMKNMLIYIYYTQLLRIDKNYVRNK